MPKTPKQKGEEKKQLSKDINRLLSLSIKLDIKHGRVCWETQNGFSCGVYRVNSASFNHVASLD